MGKGIYLFEMDPLTGKLTLVELAAEARNPSWLSFDPSGRHLYSVNEVADYEGHSGSVSAYAVNRTTGDIQLLNVASSDGRGPLTCLSTLQGSTSSLRITTAEPLLFCRFFPRERLVQPPMSVVTWVPSEAQFRPVRLPAALPSAVMTNLMLT